MADMTLKMLLLGKDVSASKALHGVGKKTDENAGKFQHWGTIAAASGVIAGVAIAKFGKDSIKAYTDAQTSQAMLTDAFKKFPALADTNQAALGRLNTELAKKTKYDDDATASGQATLAQFKLTGGQITQLTPLLQDYAAKTGKDLPTAAKDLGKAMLGQGKALKGVGINFKDTGTASGNFKELMGGLNTQVGGFAENEGKTAAGQAEILKNQFGEVEETVGSKLVPALMKLAGILLSVIGFVQRNATVIGVLAGVVLTAVAAALIYNTAMGIYAVLTGAATAETIGQTLALGAMKVAQGIATAAQWAWNAAISANPIGLIIIAIAAFVAVIIIAWKHSETFRAIVLGALHGIQAGFWATVHAIQTAWNAVYSHIIKPVGRAASWIATKLGQVVGWFRGIPSKLGSALSSVASFITAPFRAAFNAISDAWNNTVGRLHWSVPGWVPYIGGNTISAPTLPHFAAGVSGVISRPGAFVAGESGPEAISITPLSAGRRGGGGDTIINNIHLHGLIDSASAAREIEQVMQNQTRRTGRPAQFAALRA